MNIYTLDHTGMISYEILSKYHFSAKMIYENCLKRNEPVEVNFTHKINIEANNEEEVKEQYYDYANRLNDLGIFYHLSHIGYLIENLVRLEGSFIEEDSILHKYIKANVEELIKIIKLRDNPQGLVIEVSRKAHQKNQDNYIKLSNPKLVVDTLNMAAKGLINKIQQEENHIPFELIDEIKALKEPDLDQLNKLNDKLINITDKAFKSEFLYTVCETLRKYLNEQTTLNPSGAFLTNDQARVIYDACKLFGLIVPKDPDTMDFDKINYIKAILRNGLNKGLSVSEPSIITIYTSGV